MQICATSLMQLSGTRLGRTERTKPLHIGILILFSPPGTLRTVIYVLVRSLFGFGVSDPARPCKYLIGLLRILTLSYRNGGQRHLHNVFNGVEISLDMGYNGSSDWSLVWRHIPN